LRAYNGKRVMGLLEPPIPLCVRTSARESEFRHNISRRGIFQMSRKNWSNLLIFIAAVNCALSILPTNPLRIANWIAIPFCLVLGTLARRRMIPKAAFTTFAAIGNEADDV
jgi:hypothetical protein